MPSPKELAAQASADSKDLLREAMETGQLTNTWQSVDQLFTQTGLATNTSRPRLPEPASSDPVMELISKYGDKIFADENVVERPVGALVFGLSGNVLCSDPRTNALPSPDCVSQLDKLQLRLKASAGPDLTLQVGPARLEPVVIRLRSKVSFAVEADLEATQKAVEFVNQTLGNSSPANGVSVTSKGRVEVKLQRNGDHDFTVSYSNVAPIEVKYVDTTGQTRSWFSEARNPVTSLRVEGPAKKVTLLLDQGRLEGKGPSTDFLQSYAVAQPDGGTKYVPAQSVPVSYTLGGLSAEVRLAEGKDPVVSRIGLGTQQSVITYDGRRLASVDLNADLGRTFEVALKALGSGFRADVTPGIEAKVYLGLGVLPQEAKAHAAFLDATLSGSFKASSGPASIQFIPATETKGSTTQMVSGTLSLSTSQAGHAPKLYSAGACLGSSSSSTHPVLDAFASVQCP